VQATASRSRSEESYSPSPSPAAQDADKEAKKKRNSGFDTQELPANLKAVEAIAAAGQFIHNHTAALQETMRKEQILKGQPDAAPLPLTRAQMGQLGLVTGTTPAAPPAASASSTAKQQPVSTAAAPNKAGAMTGVVSKPPQGITGVIPKAEALAKAAGMDGVIPKASGTLADEDIDWDALAQQAEEQSTGRKFKAKANKAESAKTKTTAPVSLDFRRSAAPPPAKAAAPSRAVVSHEGAAAKAAAAIHALRTMSASSELRSKRQDVQTSVNSLAASLLGDQAQDILRGHAPMPRMPAAAPAASSTQDTEEATSRAKAQAPEPEEPSELTPEQKKLVEQLLQQQAEREREAERSKAVLEPTEDADPAATDQSTLNFWLQRQLTSLNSLYQGSRIAPQLPQVAALLAQRRAAGL